jgi:hypothetical protein
MDVFRLIWVNPNFQKSDLALDYLNQKVLKGTMVLYHYHVTPLERDDLTLVALEVYLRVAQSDCCSHWGVKVWIHQNWYF